MADAVREETRLVRIGQYELSRSWYGSSMVEPLSSVCASERAGRSAAMPLAGGCRTEAGVVCTGWGRCGCVFGAPRDTARRWSDWRASGWRETRRKVRWEPTGLGREEGAAEAVDGRCTVGWGCRVKVVNVEGS